MIATCTIPDCARPFYARGWCAAHYRRWQRHGDPRGALPVQPRARNAASYGATLRRLRAERGLAALRLCAECGAAAVCWSYDGGDPEARADPRTGVRFSHDPDRYRPRCWFCHRRASTGRCVGLGRARRTPPELDVQRAIRLYQAGASCRGIGSVMGVSEGAVRAALHAHGVNLRASGRPRR
jgi:hypothetical protein